MVKQTCRQSKLQQDYDDARVTHSNVRAPKIFILRKIVVEVKNIKEFAGIFCLCTSFHI